MATELLPGVFTTLFARLGAEAEARAGMALEAVGDLVHDRAVQVVSARSHAYRTPTPARRGGPPASISGTLAKSLTRTPAVPGVLGWEVKVGTAAGMFPAYSSRTPSSLYGLYLETSGAGRSHIRYPFLADSLHKVGEPAAITVFKTLFASGWGTI